MARTPSHARARRLTVVAAFAGAPLLLLRLPEPADSTSPDDARAEETWAEETWADAPAEAWGDDPSAEEDPCAPIEPTDPWESTTTTTTTTTTTLPDQSTSLPEGECPEPTAPGTVAPDPGHPDSTTPASPAPASPAPASPAPGGPAPASSAPDSSTADSSAADSSANDGTTVSTDPTSAAPETSAPTTSSTAAPDPNLAEPQLPEPPPAGWPVRAITFPVAGPVTYFDDWGACRGGAGCPRHHIGNDVIAMRLQPLLAAADGTVTHLVLDHATAGWGLVITDAEGWDYRYYHVNNDAPGTDDGSDPVQWRWAPGIAEGSVVRAGQVVAYVGDSGNSETSVPHLHFEIHQPDGRAINPYASLRAAEAAQRCRPVGDGSEETLLPVPPPANAVVEVRTRTGRGAFHLGPDGTTWLTGDALTVGWDRHAAEDPACPAMGTAAPASSATAFATPWVPPSTAPALPAPPGAPHSSNAASPSTAPPSTAPAAG